MLTLPEAMQADLTAGLTTHCWCWRITRRDGAVFGFTDHDRPLDFGGVIYSPGSGFAGADLDRQSGLAPGQADLAGALNADVLTRDSLEAGLWDGAEVALLRVDWQRPDLHARTACGRLGEIRYGGTGFQTELLGPADALKATFGRAFCKRCDAQLGDARCGVPASHAEFDQGCDQRFETCRERFANTLNFRGFPYMVGNDVLQAGPASEARRDGGTRQS